MNKKRKIQYLKTIAMNLRLKAFETISNAKSGHLGAASSSAELMTALYFGSILRFDPKFPRHPDRDRVLVRGHLGPLRYNLFAAIGWVKQEELKTYRQLGSRLQGHESMEQIEGIDITPSGSLGMILSYGVGCAYALKQRSSNAVTYVFLGDGEEQEGNVSEAARHASALGLANLVCILDLNGKQLSNSTNAADGRADVEKVWRGYGWDVRVIRDGHNVEEIVSALKMDRSKTKPTIYIAHTEKSLGIAGNKEHYSGYHTIKTCEPAILEKSIGKLRRLVNQYEREFGPFEKLIAACLADAPMIPPAPNPTILQLKKNLPMPVLDSSDYNEALVKLLRVLIESFKPPEQRRLYVLTADWNNQDQVKMCGLDKPWVRYVDVGIREQHMTAMAHGIAVSDPESMMVVFDGDAFAYRSADQLHAVAQAKTPIIVIGTDSGLCEARNGSTHQSESQPGMLLTMPNLTLLESSDEEDLWRCFNEAFRNIKGPFYLRLHSGKIKRLPSRRKNTPSYCCYDPKSKVSLNLVTSGILTFQAVDFAAKVEKTNQIGVKVINVLKAQSLNGDFVRSLAPEAPVLIAFNGNPYVLQSAVAKALLLKKHGWNTQVLGHGFVLGTTGVFADLLRHFRLDSDGLESVARELFPQIWK